MVGLFAFSAGLAFLYGRYIRYRTNLLPDNHPHKPIQINDKWENDDIRDILAVKAFNNRLTISPFYFY